MTVIRCPHCGTANREGSNFCNSCGVELHAHVRPETGEPHSPEDVRTPAAPPEPEPESPAPVSPPAPETGTAEREPWVRMDFTAEEDAPPFEEEEFLTPDHEAIIASGIPGLLAPVRIAVDESDREPEVATSRPAASDNQADLWRRVRTRMATPPLLAGLNLPGVRPPLPNLQIRWLFLLLTLAVTVPALFSFAWPSGSATQWPGVQEAFAAVDGLPVNAHVLIYWAYDPSTSGELDLEALPVSEHLFRKRARLSVVTQLPGGPATARSLLERARLNWQRNEELTAAAQSTWAVPIAYLPGGASLLALAAQNPQGLFLGSNLTTMPAGEAAFSVRPDLSVVFAAQADDVQHWLEQVQPRVQAPVVAVVAAGADPVLRPYLDSGQLAGLVSGFDGAFHYRRLLNEQASRADTGWLDMQLVLQDWGQFIFFLVIVLGNFASVLMRGQRG